MTRVVLDRIRPEDRAELVDLAADVIASRPTYARDVASGRSNAADWFDRKPLSWARVAMLGGHVVGHVGVKANSTLPDNTQTPAGHDQELCRLMVHPRHQRAGVATALVDLAVSVHGPRLWATVAPGGPSHRLLAGRGWTPAQEAWFPDAGTFGLVVCSTEATTRR